MAKVKTLFTNQEVSEFISSIQDIGQKQDSLKLLKLMEDATGEKAKMFGASIIGFGKYHYQYASGHNGEAPILGFSPRKKSISLYVYSGCQGQQEKLKDLGKFKMGKACIYIKKLGDLNISVLNDIMAQTIEFISSTHQRI